jgi:molybdate transport system substrate-binding protein
VSHPLRGLCSKAPADLLADLAGLAASSSGTGLRTHFESAGGVEVARRVRAGEWADLVVLADDVMQDLDDEGLLVVGSRRDLFVSDVVLGVREGSPVPALATPDDLVALLADVPSVGYSTGPSGRSFLGWLEAVGLADEVGPRLVRAEPGVPVARLVAEGRCVVGIQQRSEMAGTAGVVVAGPLPGDAAITSTFTGGVLATSRRPEEAARVLAFLGSAGVRAAVEAGGMHLAAP